MKKINYRHYICISITLGFVAVSVFVFPNAFGRLIESFRDFSLSIAFYFCKLFNIDFSFSVTVNDLPKVPFFPFLEGYDSPATSLPETWNGFQSSWVAYWQKWASKDNFFAYLGKISDILYVLSKALLIVIPFVIAVIMLFGRITKTQNNDYDKESKPLRIFKIITYYTYRPVKIWLIGFFAFVRKNGIYWKIWLCLWLFNFNVLTIIVEFFAFYFYFVISFDVLNIYRQVYKLFLDLWAAIDFIPLWVWVCIGIYALCLISINRGYQNLSHRERCNRGLINERGVVTIVYGEMGAGKTALITDMALSAEVQLRDDAFEVILESDIKFPNFHWSKFENVLRWAISQHVIYDVWSCRRFIRKRRKKFMRKQCREQIYGYDYERYGLTYDDKLKLTDIWEILEDYACAYLIYTVQSSLIVSNYSIRVDSLMSDLGNFPLWDCDFFKRDSRLIDSFSRHSKILDQDMLRLGKIMLKNNPNRNAYGFGIYVVTEIDKERKNTPELKGVEAKAEECNQKNDLFNVMLKMSRHACVIANRVFVKVIGDLQRPESLGADARELGEVVYIDNQTEMSPALPFFSPFWVFELFYLWIKRKYDKFYSKYKYMRADRTLSLYLIKNATAVMTHHYERVNNLFGSATLSLEVESGRLNGEAKKRKYYRQSKKIWAKRYATDCLSGIFEARGDVNKIGVNDLREYADIMATNDELLSQHSHFQNEVHDLSQNIA